MTKCPPALAVGLNRWTAPRCCQAVPIARQDFGERQTFEAIRAGTLLTRQ